MKKTKNNWWIIVVAFVIGLLIGYFLLTNLFVKDVSLGPKSCFDAYISTFASCMRTVTYSVEDSLIACHNAACSELGKKCKKQLGVCSSGPPIVLPSSGTSGISTPPATG